MSKVLEYVGFFHLLKDRVQEYWTQFWSSSQNDDDESDRNFRVKVRDKLERLKTQTMVKIHDATHPSEQEDFSHIYRSKTRKELCKISAAVMGIEFSYAAETAFVSPLLLNLGLRHRHMTLMWMLSPMLGFFITPILGSLSDGCRSVFGRRRPFIILLSIGIILGLILVPNGKTIGLWLGDTYTSEKNNSNQNLSPSLYNLSKSLALESGASKSLYLNYSNKTISKDGDVSPVVKKDIEGILFSEIFSDDENNDEEIEARREASSIAEHPWGLIMTVIGTVLLDFDADACQSPSRAYMLDITLPEDHARGLSTFTIMAGLGGSFGYFLGALNWEGTFIGDWFGGHVRAVFTLVLFLFIACVVTTIRSFREVPITTLFKPNKGGIGGESGGYQKFEEEYESGKTYGTIHETSFSENKSHEPLTIPPIHEEGSPTFREYVRTIVQLPKSLQWLCLTNFFSWMSLVCYSLYFTDFVGEAVFGGKPSALPGSPTRKLYEDGVRFGCWGMALYSLSCSIYSLVIDSVIQRFGAKKTYFYGQLIYSCGMVLMGITRHPFGVIIFSWTAGIMYATLFTMPYLLVARYHAAETFEVDIDDLTMDKKSSVRGLGTDVAIVSSMVFLAQMTQSLILGNVVAAAGTTTAIVFAASVFAACGAFASTRVLYLDL